MNATEPLTDILPERECGRMTIHFHPGLLPGCGVVEIAGKRNTTTYTVNEFPTRWAGRAFRFAKLDGEGTDRTEEAYAVFCSDDPRQHKCECRGFTRWRNCKHLDAATTLITNGWL